MLFTVFKQSLGSLFCHISINKVVSTKKKKEYLNLFSTGNLFYRFSNKINLFSNASSYPYDKGKLNPGLCLFLVDY